MNVPITSDLDGYRAFWFRVVLAAGVGWLIVVGLLVAILQAVRK